MIEFVCKGDVKRSNLIAFTVYVLAKLLLCCLWGRDQFLTFVTLSNAHVHMLSDPSTGDIFDELLRSLLKLLHSNLTA